MIISFYHYNCELHISVKLRTQFTKTCLKLLQKQQFDMVHIVRFNATYPCFLLAIRIHKYKMCCSKVQGSYWWFAGIVTVQHSDILYLQDTSHNGSLSSNKQLPSPPKWLANSCHQYIIMLITKRCISVSLQESTIWPKEASALI